MNAERWRRIQSVFHGALLEPPDPAVRRAFVTAACDGDMALAEEVLAMIEEDSRPAASLLDRGAELLAAGLIAEPLSPPRRIGPYRIVAEAGRGGMGVVYLAERDDLGSRAAIKVLPHAWLSPTRRTRFELEERTLSRLTHPAIARILDAGVLDEDGTPWFAMEWVDGEPITKYAARLGLDVPARLQLFRQVCEAVQYAHAQAVLHRDLKPSNIFVNSSASVRLLDFGIAKQLDPAGDGRELTQTGLALMTPAYAAPEVVRGKPAAVPADVYSLGVVLYELLAGAPAFALEGRTPAEALALLETHTPLPPSASATRATGAGKAAWADLDILCRTAMHRDLARRYTSVEALLRDVERFLAGEALEARPDDNFYKLRKYVLRHWRPLAAAGLGVTALLALAAFFTWRLASARDAALAETARTRRIQQFMLDLFEGGDKQAGPAEDLKVLTLIDRGARNIEQLERDPAAQADLLQTLGGVYQGLGKYEQSSAMLTAALARRRGLAGAQQPALEVESLEALGLLRAEQGRLGDAERLVRQAVNLAQAKLPALHPATSSALAALGRVQLDQGQYRQSIDTLQQALGFPLPEAERAPRLIRLANAHFYSGDYVRAEAISLQVLDIYGRIYGRTHPSNADPLINLGAVAHQRGQYVQAESWYRRALEVNRAHYGGRHPETAACLMGIARALTFQKRFAEAEPLLNEVLAIREGAYGLVHPNVASTLASLGHTALQQGKFDLAEQRFGRMADIYRAVNGDGHHFVGLAKSNLASVYLEKADYARAEALLREVLRSFGALFPADHPDTAIARVKLGRTLLRQGRRVEAKQETSAALRVLEVKSPQSVFTATARADLAELTRLARQR